MSEQLPSETDTKAVNVSGWATQLPDDREVFVGYKTDAPEEGFYLYFRNKEHKTYLRLSDDATLALHASLSSAIEYIKKTDELRSLAYKIRVDIDDPSKLPPGHWSLVEEDT